VRRTGEMRERYEMSFMRGMKDRRRENFGRNVFHERDEGQK